MTEQGDPIQRPEPISAEKLPYHAPHLREHGTVDELTLGSTSGGTFADSAPPYDDPTPPLS